MSLRTRRLMAIPGASKPSSAPAIIATKIHAVSDAAAERLSRKQCDGEPAESDCESVGSDLGWCSHAQRDTRSISALAVMPLTTKRSAVNPWQHSSPTLRLKMPSKQLRAKEPIRCNRHTVPAHVVGLAEHR